MLKLWNVVIQNWHTIIFDPKTSITRHQLLPSIETLAITTILIVVLVAIGILTHDYLHYRKSITQYNQLKQTYQKAKLAHEDDTNYLEMRNLQYHSQHTMDKIQKHIDKSLWSDKTPILSVLTQTLAWSLMSYIGFGLSLLILYCIFILGGFGFTSLYPQIKALPIDILVTILIALIPIAGAIKRNKPQWLKLTLVIAELIAIVAIILEFIALAI